MSIEKYITVLYGIILSNNELDDLLEEASMTLDDLENERIQELEKILFQKEELQLYKNILKLHYTRTDEDAGRLEDTEEKFYINYYESKVIIYIKGRLSHNDAKRGIGNVFSAQIVSAENFRIETDEQEALEAVKKFYELEAEIGMIISTEIN